MQRRAGGAGGNEDALAPSAVERVEQERARDHAVGSFGRTEVALLDLHSRLVAVGVGLRPGGEAGLERVGVEAALAADEVDPFSDR